MKSLWRHFVLPSRVFSPRGLLLRAALPVLLFLALSAFGGREYTTLMTGTSPDGGPVRMASLALAVAYVMTHLATVVLAPVLALAALFWAGYLYARGRGKDQPETSRN